MALSLLLAKVFGPYLVVIGVVALHRRKEISVRLSHVFKNKGLLYTMSALELLTGLFIVVGHSVWSGWPLIITILGWLMVLEAILYLFAPNSLTKKVITWFSQKTWYTLFSVISIVLGIYLIVVAF